MKPRYEMGFSSFSSFFGLIDLKWVYSGVKISDQALVTCTYPPLILPSHTNINISATVYSARYISSRENNRPSRRNFFLPLPLTRIHPRIPHNPFNRTTVSTKRRRRLQGRAEDDCRDGVGKRAKGWRKSGWRNGRG